MAISSIRSIIGSEAHQFQLSIIQQETQTPKNKKHLAWIPPSMNMLGLLLLPVWKHNIYFPFCQHTLLYVIYLSDLSDIYIIDIVYALPLLLPTVTTTKFLPSEVVPITYIIRSVDISHRIKIKTFETFRDTRCGNLAASCSIQE